MNVTDVIKRPLITEKGTLVNELGNQVVFRVRPRREQGRDPPGGRELFKVKVEKVRTASMLGKTRRVGQSRRAAGRTGRRPT